MWNTEIFFSALSLIGLFLIGAILGFVARSCNLLSTLKNDMENANKELKEMKSILLKTEAEQELWKSIAKAKEAVKEAKDKLALLPPDVREELIRDLSQSTKSVNDSTSSNSKAILSQR